MPTLKSAFKRMRQNEQRNLRNRVRKSRVNTGEKAFNEAIAKGDADAAKKALETCFSTLDKAAKSGSIHGNKADRKKGRLAARLKKIAIAK